MDFDFQQLCSFPIHMNQQNILKIELVVCCTFRNKILRRKKDSLARRGGFATLLEAEATVVRSKSGRTSSGYQEDGRRGDP